MATKKAVRKAAHRRPATVVLMLNGQSSGVHTPAGGDTVGAVAQGIARNAGLKSYSILVNGTKIGTEAAANGLRGVTSIEVFAKETRGIA